MSGVPTAHSVVLTIDFDQNTVASIGLQPRIQHPRRQSRRRWGAEEKPPALLVAVRMPWGRQRGATLRRRSRPVVLRARGPRGGDLRCHREGIAAGQRLEPRQQHATTPLHRPTDLKALDEV